MGAALGGRLTHSEYETSKTYSIVSFRADRKQSQTPQTLSFFQTSNIMAEEAAIAETDAILENAKNKHEVRCSIYRKTKLIERYGMFKSPIKNVMTRVNNLGIIVHICVILNENLIKILVILIQKCNFDNNSDTFCQTKCQN